MDARRLIESSSYGPETLHVIFQVFDEAWGEIAKTFGDESLRVCDWRTPFLQWQERRVTMPKASRITR